MAGCSSSSSSSSGRGCGRARLFEDGDRGLVVVHTDSATVDEYLSELEVPLGGGLSVGARGLVRGVLERDSEGSVTR